MIAKLLPILSLLIGTGAGVAAGMFLTDPNPESHEAFVEEVETHADKSAESEFVKLNNQFVVPLVKNDKVAALVVLSLGLEVEQGMAETVYQREPKLRDGFLRVLFDQAVMGTFDGAFTRVERLDALRAALLEEARAQIGDSVRTVLITDIARQDT
ncbi:flagellar basal body-associated FliL family protein [Jhaorihella thermophila]|uniref:Flagellar protein FliL n=1 Tax=Jhaorihella thermophila TaxID=488547 RepID=A0A1H5XSZ8_9RHOB|nr:flagellar basal body-associated FliL family protein [Jhaorihella thermophila]SEG14655.1 Flagellar basal body-associated protein FliL [Jhaorihella thermophila]